MVESRTWVKIPLFLSSYFPLWLIFLGFLVIDDTKYHLFTKPIAENQVVFWSVVGFSLLVTLPPLIVYLALWTTKKENNSFPISVKFKEDSTNEYVIYVVTYIIPFMVDNFLEPARIFALVVMMVTIGALYIRTNYFHINPILNLFGYKLYKIFDESNNKYLLLSKRGKIKNSQKINATALNLNIYVESEENC